jgi:hypothetical protein
MLREAEGGGAPRGNHKLVLVRGACVKLCNGVCNGVCSDRAAPAAKHNKQ